MELVKISYTGITPGEQDYRRQDLSLITPSTISPLFGQGLNDYIEYFIRDLNGNIIGKNYFATNYKPGVGTSTQNGYSTIQLDPEQDVRSSNVGRGTTRIKYNFFRYVFNSSPANKLFWIKEISPSRTELKVARQDLSNVALQTAFGTFNTTANGTNYYPDFYLNFGLDQQFIAVNTMYIEEDGIGYLLIKLYEPLPFDYDVKDQFWTIQKVADSIEFEVSIEVEADAVVENNRLRGPNYKVSINQKQNQTTPYYNYNTLFSTPISSSYQQLQSWSEDKAVSINVDYSNFSNFIHFSSATERLLNFEYKARLIENYKNDMLFGSQLANAPINIVGSTNTVLQQNIDNIINKFDPYEYYLYFESASTAWPKQTDIAPYELYSVTSSQVLDWLGSTNTVPVAGKMSILYTASLYDNLNKDNLNYTMPAYIREDDLNTPYHTFLNMIGQHFDNIWLYYKDISNRYSADNNPQSGISLDIVADALRGFGVELYTNSNISDNIYYSILGINDTGSALPLTSSQYGQVDISTNNIYPPVGSSYLSQSIYLPPFGNEFIKKYTKVFTTPSTGETASFGPIPPMQLESEYYKRLYHNLPYLLKTRGTQRGVKALIACYGIPESILTVNEFGGGDIFAAPDLQQLQNEKVFTASLSHISGNVLTPFATTQYYSNNLERGSADIEVGFSPADSINAHITGTLSNFNIMQYIGNPALQYSSSYSPLDVLSSNYFRTHYTQRYNVWDFIRLIKFYNNSLFKSIKDYVPARASLTSGIIIKPHILERNKYARHEPVITRPEHSQSIDLVRVSGQDAPDITTSTAYDSITYFPSGTTTIQHQYHFEPYTGEFSGSIIDPTNGYFPQIEQSSIPTPWTSSVGGRTEVYTTYSLNYLYNNVTGSVRSNRFLDLDYSSNPNVPVNFGLITQSINNYPASLNDPYAPFAELQDYNYYIQRSILPRYSGSKSISRYYNIYTPGDTSYGNNPAIDWNAYKLGWVKTIPTESRNFYEKTQINLKYLVDSDLNITELSANNDNVVEVQNTFKSGDPVRVSITDVQFPSNQTSLDGTKNIYRGGYRFDPIIYREDNEQLTFQFDEPISQSIGYIGVRARAEETYQYTCLAIFTRGIEGAPSNQTNTNSGYTPNYQFLINGQRPGTPTIQMASRYFSETDWNTYLQTSQNATNGLAGSYVQRLNFTVPAPLQPNLRTSYNARAVYQFDLVQFTQVERNNEPIQSSFATSGSYMYKVPRSSIYHINGNIPFKYEGQLFNVGYIVNNTSDRGVGFKPVMVIEKTTDPTDPTLWTIVAASTLNIQSVDFATSVDPASNTVKYWQNTNAYNLPLNTGYFKCELNENIRLLEGEYIRIMFYLVDLVDLFGISGTKGTQSFKFTIGGRTNNQQLIPNADRPFIEIFDNSTAYPVYAYTSSYANNAGPFFVTSSTQTDTLIFTTATGQYFESASTFLPTTSTERYYTTIVDHFGIQPYDLIRISKFAEPRPEYFTVVSATTGSRAPVTITGDFVVFPFIFGIQFVWFSYNYNTYGLNQFFTGDTVTISGTGTVNDGPAIMAGTPIPINNTTALVFFTFTGSPFVTQTGTTATFTFTGLSASGYRVQLDRSYANTTIPISDANFAILRPKPDETSVILDFRKRPGLVAQTLLLPTNASSTLIDSTGNIFQSLNVQLG